MRTLKLRPTLPSFPSCMHRKVSDEPSVKKRALEMGDFPLQILESKRRERLAELKAECLELKHQLSEHSLEAALIREESQKEDDSGGNSKQSRVLSGRHSKSMHELSSSAFNSAVYEESMRLRRQERLHNLRRELEQFAIKYSIGEYAEKIDGLEESSGYSLQKSASENLVDLEPPSEEPAFLGSLQDLDAANVGILLRIQRQREQELQRARLELKILAFRVKHKLDEENNSTSDPPSP